MLKTTVLVHTITTPISNIKAGAFIVDCHTGEIVRVSEVKKIQVEYPAILLETNRGGRLFNPDDSVEEVQFPKIPYDCD